MTLPEKALELATKAHTGQKRRDGKTDYISHPIAVSRIVTNFINKFIAFKHIEINGLFALIRDASNRYNTINLNANTASFLDLFQIIAIGHDIFEDSNLTIEEFISELKEVNQDKEVYSDIFFEEIKSALILLTHNEKDSYLDYILRVKQNKFASIVKISDIEHNISTRNGSNTAGEIKRDKIAIEKYRLAEYILLN